MTINPKVYNFPTFPISKQLFYVPGATVEGGFTSGGARISYREPGGFSMLEIQPAMQVAEWDHPVSSWLMSKTNGQILRVRLAPTPQVSTARLIRNAAGVSWDENILWNNLRDWDGGDISLQYLNNVGEGNTQIFIDMGHTGQLLRAGHVIGHGDTTYLIDEIEYDENNVALITVALGLRRDIAAGDTAYLRPYFTGQVVNGDELRATYDAENNGNIQPGKITLSEVILP